MRLWTVLARCYATYAKAVAGRVTEYGLTMPQFRTLQMLYYREPLSFGELADKLLVTGGNVTYIMDRLEERGLAARHRSPDDRRILDARLSASGRALLDGICLGHTGLIEQLSRHLTEDEQETMRLLLKRLGKGIAGSDL